MMWESHSYVGRVCQDTLHNKEIHKQNVCYPNLKAKITQYSSIDK